MAIIMFIFVSFFIFLILVIFLILLFCNKHKKQGKNTVPNNHHVYFEISIAKFINAKFDYETNNKKDN